MKANDIGIGATPELKDQFLVVETNSDGYTGVVDGNYNYEVVTEGSDYKIYPTFYNEAEQVFKASDEMVVYTEGDTVWYVVGTTADPYNHASIEQLVVETGMEKENRVLQTFMLYANDRFTLGNYNVFLTGNLNLAESPNVVEVTGVIFDKTEVTVDLGETKQVTASVLPKNASNKAVRMEEVDTDKATVVQNGNVFTITGNKSGGETSLLIRSVEDGTKYAQCTIKVNKPITKLSFPGATYKMQVGKSTGVPTRYAPSDAYPVPNYSKFIYSVDDPTIVSVTKDGGITALKPGVTTLRSRYEGVDSEATVVITVEAVPVTGVTLDKTEMTLQNGQSGKVTATVLPENATNKAVEYQPMSSDVAIVDGAGNITTMGAGEVDITATTEDGSFVAKCKLTVTE